MELSSPSSGFIRLMDTATKGPRFITLYRIQQVHRQCSHAMSIDGVRLHSHAPPLWPGFASESIFLVPGLHPWNHQKVRLRLARIVVGMVATVHVYPLLSPLAFSTACHVVPQQPDTACDPRNQLLAPRPDKAPCLLCRVLSTR